MKYSILSPLFIVAIWIIVRLWESCVGSLAEYGIVPRSISGLWGILFAPFLHGNWGHLFSNALPFIVLCALLLFFYPRRFALLSLCIISIFSGLLLWVIGQPGVHIGASGVIYGLASTLVFMGIFHLNIRLTLISIVIVILYGYFIYGLYPNRTGISWDGHLSGAIIGFIWAYCSYRWKWLKVKKI